MSDVCEDDDILAAKARLVIDRLDAYCGIAEDAARPAGERLEAARAVAQALASLGTTTVLFRYVSPTLRARLDGIHHLVSSLERVAS